MEKSAFDIPIEPEEISPDPHFEMRAFTYGLKSRILLLEFEGMAGMGSGSNHNCRVMRAMIATAKRFTPAEGIILDFRNFKYEWGDLMSMPLGESVKEGIDYPVIICDPADFLKDGNGFMGLVRWEMGLEPGKCMFSSLEDAITRMEAQIDQKKATEHITASIDAQEYEAALRFAWSDEMGCDLHARFRQTVLGMLLAKRNVPGFQHLPKLLFIVRAEMELLAKDPEEVSFGLKLATLILLRELEEEILPEFLQWVVDCKGIGDRPPSTHPLTAKRLLHLLEVTQQWGREGKLNDAQVNAGTAWLGRLLDAVRKS